MYFERYSWRNSGPERVLMGEITWAEEGSSNGHATGSRKRKVRPKRFQFVGWGSRQLIEFLQSLGKDTTNKISRFEVSETIARYIAENGLLDSSNKKKVACDDRLISLFGTRTILRIKVYDLLEKHYEENQDDSDFDYLYEDEPQIICHSEKIASRTRKVVQKKPRGTFAAIVSDNIKLLYLRKSLVQELVKSPENLEGKMLGSFVRIKSDPNDYLQINPYQLVQVTGNNFLICDCVRFIRDFYEQADSLLICCRKLSSLCNFVLSVI